MDMAVVTVPATSTSGYPARILVSCSVDATVRLWDFVNRKELQVLRGHTREVTCVAYSDYAELLISGGADSFLYCWSLDCAQPLQRIYVENPDALVISIQTIPGTPELITCDSRGVFCVYDLRDTSLVQRFSHSVLITHSISSVTCALDTRILFASSSDQGLVRFDKVQPLHLDQRFVRAVLQQKQELARAKTMASTRGPVGRLTASSKYLVELETITAAMVSAAAEKKMRLSRLQSDGGGRADPDAVALANAPIPVVTTKADAKRIRLQEQINDDCRMPIVWCAYNQVTLSIVAASSQNVMVWDALTGRVTAAYRDLMPGMISAAALDFRARRLFVGDNSGQIRCFDLANGAFMRDYTPHLNEVSALAYSTHRTEILSGSWDCTVRCHEDITQTDDAAPYRAGRSHKKDVTVIACSDALDLYATGSLDCVVHVFDPPGLSLTPIECLGSITALTFLGDLPFLAIADGFGEVTMFRTFNATDCTCILQFFNTKASALFGSTNVRCKNPFSDADVGAKISRVTVQAAQSPSALKPMRALTIDVETEKCDSVPSIKYRVPHSSEWVGVTALFFDADSLVLFTGDEMGFVKAWDMSDALDAVGKAIVFEKPVPALRSPDSLFRATRFAPRSPDASKSRSSIQLISSPTVASLASDAPAGMMDSDFALSHAPESFGLASSGNDFSLPPAHAGITTPTQAHALNEAPASASTDDIPSAKDVAFTPALAQAADTILPPDASPCRRRSLVDQLLPQVTLRRSQLPDDVRHVHPVLLDIGVDSLSAQQPPVLDASSDSLAPGGSVTAKSAAPRALLERRTSLGYSLGAVVDNESDDEVGDAIDGTTMRAQGVHRAATQQPVGVQPKARSAMFPNMNMQPFLVFKAHKNKVTGMKIIVDARQPTLMTWGFDGAIHLFDLRDGTYVASMDGTTNVGDDHIRAAAKVPGRVLSTPGADNDGAVLLGAAANTAVVAPASLTVTAAASATVVDSAFDNVDSIATDAVGGPLLDASMEARASSTAAAAAAASDAAKVPVLISSNWPLAIDPTRHRTRSSAEINRVQEVLNERERNSKLVGTLTKSPKGRRSSPTSSPITRDLQSSPQQLELLEVGDTIPTSTVTSRSASQDVLLALFEHQRLRVDVGSFSHEAESANASSSPLPSLPPPRAAGSPLPDEPLSPSPLSTLMLMRSASVPSLQPPSPHLPRIAPSASVPKLSSTQTLIEALDKAKSKARSAAEWSASTAQARFANSNIGRKGSTLPALSPPAAAVDARGVLESPNLKTSASVVSLHSAVAASGRSSLLDNRSPSMESLPGSGGAAARKPWNAGNLSHSDALYRSPSEAYLASSLGAAVFASSTHDPLMELPLTEPQRKALGRLNQALMRVAVPDDVQVPSARAAPVYTRPTVGSVAALRPVAGLPVSPILSPNQQAMRRPYNAINSIGAPIRDLDVSPPPVDWQRECQPVQGTRIPGARPRNRAPSLSSLSSPQRDRDLLLMPVDEQWRTTTHAQLGPSLRDVQCGVESRLETSVDSKSDSGTGVDDISRSETRGSSSDHEDSGGVGGGGDNVDHSLHDSSGADGVSHLTSVDAPIVAAVEVAPPAPSTPRSGLAAASILTRAFVLAATCNSATDVNQVESPHVVVATAATASVGGVRLRSSASGSYGRRDSGARLAAAATAARTTSASMVPTWSADDVTRQWQAEQARQRFRAGQPGGSSSTLVPRTPLGRVDVVALQRKLGEDL